MPGPVTVVAKIRATPGKEKVLEALLIEQAAAVRKAEPGCMSYRLHRAEKDAGLFYIYEQYVDEAARTAHHNGAHLRAFREKRVAEGLLQGGVEVEVFVPLTE